MKKEHTSSVLTAI